MRMKSDLSIDFADELRDMPTNYGYDINEPVYWYNYNTDAHTKFANNWADMFDGSIMVNRLTGTGQNLIMATGTRNANGSINASAGAKDTCHGFTSDDPAGGYYSVRGSATLTDIDWLDAHHLFCHFDTYIIKLMISKNIWFR